MEPGARLKQLADMATMRAKVNHNIAPKMYLRSAIQLEQQVNINTTANISDSHVTCLCRQGHTTKTRIGPVPMFSPLDFASEYKQLYIVIISRFQIAFSAGAIVISA